MEKFTIRVAVTARFAPNLMPVNEGVIFVDNHKCTKEATEYIGTYNNILKSAKIQLIMNNIDLKDGKGQLPNAICVWEYDKQTRLDTEFKNFTMQVIQ